MTKHFIYTSTHLGLFCVVGHDVRVRDVDPVVVLPVHRAAVLSLVQVPPSRERDGDVKQNNWKPTSRTHPRQRPI